MLENIYQFWGSRDLNNFLKGSRKLENETYPEQQLQPSFWVVRDLNLFLKGNRKLEPILCPPIEKPNNLPQESPLPLDTKVQENVPILQISQPTIPPRIAGIRQNMSIIFYGLFPGVHILLSILRIFWIWIDGFSLRDILPGFILWFIAWITFIVAAFFIGCDFKLSYYKPTMIILGISLLFDVVGLLCSTIQFGISHSSNFEECNTQTLDESEGYYYDFDYISIQQRKFDICTTYETYHEYQWLIVFLVASFAIYCDFFFLIYNTYKVQPKKQPEEIYGIELIQQNRNPVT